MVRRMGGLGRRLARGLEALDAFQEKHVWLAFPFAVLRKFSNDQGGSLAALIGYYGFLSLIPLLLAFVAILGFVLGGHPDLAKQVQDAVNRDLPGLSGALGRAVEGNQVALGVGLAGALWAGLGVTLATERAMNAVWDIPLAERPNLWWSRLRGLLMLAVLGLTFLVSASLAGLQSVTGAFAIPAAVLGIAGSLTLNVTLYLVAFQVLTNRHVTWHDLLPGALVGAAGWTALQSFGVLYVNHEVAHASQLYGSLATVIGLLAWLYLGARLTLYAAEINVVLAYRLWPRSLVGGARTEADRRALVRQAEEAVRSRDQVISVDFESSEAGGERGRRGAERTGEPGE